MLKSILLSTKCPQRTDRNLVGPSKKHSDINRPNRKNTEHENKLWRSLHLIGGELRMSTSSGKWVGHKDIVRCENNQLKITISQKDIKNGQLVQPYINIHT